MDEFLDHFLSSSSWQDVNSIERLSWVGNRPAQTTVLLPNSIGVYDGGERDSTVSMVPSNHTMESLATLSSSILAGDDSTFGLNKSFDMGEAQPLEAVSNCERKSSLNGGLNGSSKSGYFSLQSNTTISTPGKLRLSSPNLFPAFGSSAMSASLLSESGHVESNGSEISEFHQSLALGDSVSLPSIPQLWPPPSYGSVSSLSPIMGQDKLHLQEEYLDSGDDVFGNKILQPDKLSASVSENGLDELHHHPLPSFAAGPQINLIRQAGLLSQPQLSQLSEGNSIKHYMNQASVSRLQPLSTTAAGGCNGTVKPRVRARRGQATDPHSIAERLRREKIAERMKNLQELVPNSNKTDKASMLDEIIEYVKFLQLQVKVLSMSRLGAAGAVVPLITDGQAEGSSGLLLSPFAGKDADASETPENIAFEQEVVKLMESNVTMAMQYLQSKGLCLMPIALAAAMSGGKASSSGPVTDDKIKKPGLIQSLLPHNNSSTVNGTSSHIASDDEIVTQDNGTWNENTGSIRTDGCCNGATVKQEAVQNTSCSDSELKPKA